MNGTTAPRRLDKKLLAEQLREESSLKNYPAPPDDLYMGAWIPPDADPATGESIEAGLFKFDFVSYYHQLRGYRRRRFGLSLCDRSSTMASRDLPAANPSSHRVQILAPPDGVRFLGSDSWPPADEWSFIIQELPFLEEFVTHQGALSALNDNRTITIVRTLHRRRGGSPHVGRFLLGDCGDFSVARALGYRLAIPGTLVTPPSVRVIVSIYIDDTVGLAPLKFLTSDARIVRLLYQLLRFDVTSEKTDRHGLTQERHGTGGETSFPHLHRP